MTLRSQTRNTSTKSSFTIKHPRTIALTPRSKVKHMKPHRSVGGTARDEGRQPGSALPPSTMPKKRPLKHDEPEDGVQHPKKPRSSPRMLSPDGVDATNSSAVLPDDSSPAATSERPTTSATTSPLTESEDSVATSATAQEPPVDAENSTTSHPSPKSSPSVTSVSQKRRRDSAQRTPSPAKKKQKPKPSASDSELSDLEATPPAPSPIRRTMAHLDRKVECTCTKACTCAKHSFHARGKAPEHLGEWMLMGMEVEESAVRGTVGMGDEREGLERQ